MLPVDVVVMECYSCVAMPCSVVAVGKSSKTDGEYCSVVFRVCWVVILQLFLCCGIKCCGC